MGFFSRSFKMIGLIQSIFYNIGSGSISSCNPLVMDTFDEAVRQEPDAHPLVHSDRGFQYTSAQFYTRLKKHHMKQSMSRVAHCIDNGPMEGFWGILKRIINSVLMTEAL